MSELLENSSSKMVPSEVPVQAGLFDYPLKEGQDPVLIANKCKCCGKRYFPRRKICPYCFEQGGLQNVFLDRRGIIYACTVVNIPSPVGIKAPYACGYVDIPADNIRIFSLFTGQDPFFFRPGQEVELVIEPIFSTETGQSIIGYKFKPIV
jgi:uncharacterized OB-fold protein